MAKLVRFLAIALLSAAIAGGCAFALANTLREFMAIAFFGGLLLGLIMGGFSEDRKARYESIKHRSGRRNYGQAAAIFIGTVCMYVGTQQDCEEVCDDLWHHGQQAHVEMLSGDESLEVL